MNGVLRSGTGSLSCGDAGRDWLCTIKGKSVSKTYLETMDAKFGFFDADNMSDAGRDLNATYTSAEPFPHIVIDNFCSPAILDECIKFFPSDVDRPDTTSFDRAQERYKVCYNPDRLPGSLRSFFYSLNSKPFLSFLENMTGVEGLIPDPYYSGAGLHQTSQGGHLSIHADFNHHKKLSLERRLNILIYLNKDWEASYGGCLELWDEKMAGCVKKISPVYNRCVVFSTTAKSFHGHPEPINHPNAIPRRSIALYYYTATWNSTLKSFTTQYKSRPSTQDKTDWRIMREELLRDALPPFVYRNAARVSRRLFKR